MLGHDGQWLAWPLKAARQTWERFFCGNRQRLSQAGRESRPPSLFGALAGSTQKGPARSPYSLASGGISRLPSSSKSGSVLSSRRTQRLQAAGALLNQPSNSSSRKGRLVPLASGTGRSSAPRPLSVTPLSSATRAVPSSDTFPVSLRRKHH